MSQHKPAELEHGCRATYGPLELRIQTTARLSGFMVYVDDPRLKDCCVFEQSVQSTLESAKDYVALRAREYLNSYQETSDHEVSWRCS
jgi:hypothetical protein